MSLIGSPRTLEIRTPGLPVNVAFYVAGVTGMNGRLCRRPLRHVLQPGELLPERPVPKRTAETKEERANRFQRLIDTGQARNRAEVARLLGCSRAWVTKVLRRQL